MLRNKKRVAAALLSGAVLTISMLQGMCVETAAKTLDSDYAGELLDKGFPQSYANSLASLHETYPQWEFEAVDTGLEWNTVLEQESQNGVNLVAKNVDDSKKSTAEGAYDWETNTWTIFDGSSWVAAHPDYIAYYMDPRNFLNETDIFQFESLSYSDSQTLEGVQAILTSTFMENPVQDADGTTLDYGEAFMQIGESVGVSPYHLASRVRQEQGLKGTSSMISGTYKGYEGYYNYFNLGASGVTSSQVIQKGLSYAKNVGWDTRYKSLAGGAQVIAKNYISVGQDTLYFQKFNVVNQKNLYRHQYMANLTAAYTEGRKMGQGYADKQQAFVFRIPVYHNMPAKPVTFTRSGNPNNYLKSLTVSGQKLTPVFSGSKIKYSLILPDMGSITIKAAPVSGKATVSLTGPKKLKKGTNTFTIRCKSENGSTRKYQLSIVCSAEKK